MFKNFENKSIVSYLDSLETIASTIHREKNTEKVVFFILQNLIEKLDLGYSEGYFFKYDNQSKTLKHLNSFFDLKTLSKEETEFLSNNLEKNIDIENSPLKNLLIGDKIHTNISKLTFSNNCKLLNRFNDFTIIPINYKNIFYGCFILDKHPFKKLPSNPSELHILELFRYNFSLYMHARELENFEIQDIKLKTIGTFANSIIHELRTPISSIVGFASLAKKNINDPKKMELYLNYIIKESEKVIKLSEDISDYTSEDDNLIEKSTTFSISSAIREAIKKLNLHFKKSQIKTYLIIQNDIEITFYKEKVVTAFYHLLKNSLENCDYQKSQRSITITIFGENDKKIVIEDNGIGIAKHKLEEVTIPFYSSKIYGTGLGLTIAKEVFTKLNFGFAIESEHYKWTKIIIK
jgi:K+-sensing histidine kinase KdpD